MGRQGDVPRESSEGHKHALHKPLVQIMRAPLLYWKGRVLFSDHRLGHQVLFWISPQYDQVPVDIRGEPNGVGIASESATIQELRDFGLRNGVTRDHFPRVLCHHKLPRRGFQAEAQGPEGPHCDSYKASDRQCGLC
jgi:hypothetical protein